MYGIDIISAKCRGSKLYPQTFADMKGAVLRDAEGRVMVQAGEVVLGKVPTSVLHWACSLSVVSGWV